MIIVICLLSPCVYAQDVHSEADAVLTSAESLFKAMQKKDFPQVWAGLSQKSRDTLVKDTYAAVKPTGDTYSEDSIYKDFAGGGTLSRSYWNAFLQKFDPILVLEQSRWEMASIKTDVAEIRILYKKAQNPAVLLMVKEDGTWKVGLTESFWARK
jgi:hypothetical protein